MPRGLNLVRYEVQSVTGLQPATWRLRMEVQDAQDMPSKIFNHQKTILDPLDDDVMDEYVGVARPVDLVTFPVDTPDPTQDPPYFRKDSAELLLNTSAEVQAVWEDTQTRVLDLITTLNRLDTLSLTGIVEIGDALEP